MRTRARTIAISEEGTGPQAILRARGILALIALVQLTVLVVVAGPVR